ncbi:MAG: hypothetical protein EXQ97_05415, partial [Alphaproteobacteria bacterium]|nr:hypothetical protein [Alphaproteobacteria bacterium]
MEQSRAANLQKSARGDVEALRRDKVREEAAALLGDPNAAVFDRHWARLAEDPARGIFTATQEGVITPGKQYGQLKQSVADYAKTTGRSVRDVSADIWTGIRETIKNKSELFGQRYRGSAITGDSKSYADHFEELIADKAKHLGITLKQMEAKLRAGDATLMSALLATPVGLMAFQEWQG